MCMKKFSHALKEIHINLRVVRYCQLKCWMQKKKKKNTPFVSSLKIYLYCCLLHCFFVCVSQWALLRLQMWEGAQFEIFMKYFLQGVYHMCDIFACFHAKMRTHTCCCCLWLCFQRFSLNLMCKLYEVKICNC